MKQVQPDRPRSVMFLASSLWFFYNHRLPLAIAARERGYRVSVAAPPDEYAARVEEQGIELIPLRIRRGLGGVSDLLAILEIASLIRQRRPDVLHLIAAKPVAYGGICARLLNVPAVVSAISGLGYAFTDNSRGSIQRSALLALYRLALRHPRQAVIFQNTEDRDLLLNAGVCSAEKSVLIEGSGVDSRRYRADRQDDRFRVVMGARLVGDKGVREFAEAAAIVKAHDPSVEFQLHHARRAGSVATNGIDSLDRLAR